MKSAGDSSASSSKTARLWQRRQRLDRLKGSDRTRRENLRPEFLEPRHMFAGDYNPTGAFQIQAQLAIFVNGQQQSIPALFGRSTGSDSNRIAGSDPNSAAPVAGTTTDRIFVKYAAGERTGANDFVDVAEIFDHWKRDTVAGNANAVFTSSTILGNTVDAAHTIKFYVNGKANSDFQNYQFKDEDQLVISYETKTVADAPTMLPLQNVSVLGGSPLYIPLNGFDPTNQNLTFTATSSNPQVTTYIPNGNTYWNINVTGYGDMLFQLFNDKASRPVDRVTTLSNQNYYDNVPFHRVINNFVIQGGDGENMNGTGGSTLGDFNDQFNTDLQLNRTGLLAYAKSGDDTNDSQFFITEGAQRHLDFNHSVFGLMVNGENVRQLISDVATTSDVPNVPIKMSSADIVTDNHDNVMMIKAPEGFTGSTDITVTVSDPDGHSFSQTFHVTVTPDTTNSPAFLNDIPAITIPKNQTSTFTLTSQDPENTARTYSLTKTGSTTNYAASVNPTTGVVTITPPTDFTGTLTLKAVVTSTSSFEQAATDEQVFSVTVGAARTLTVDLDTASDTGSSTSDNITNAAALSLTVSGAQSGDVIRLYDGTTQVAEQTATGATVTFSVSNATEAAHSYQARFVSNGTETVNSNTLAVTVDRTAQGDFVSHPPTKATATEAFHYDADHSTDSVGGVFYQLQNPPSGMTIDANTGEVSWTPTAQQTGSVTFNVLATDLAGNSDTQAVSLTVNPFVQAQASLTFGFLDANGDEITSVPQGGNFFLVVFGQDLTTNPKGFSGFDIDVHYTAALATNTGTRVIHAPFSVLGNDSTLNVGAGIYGKVTGLDISPYTEPNPGEPHELFRIPMKATGSGSILFEGTTSTIGLHNVATQESASIDPLAVRFTPKSLDVAAPFTAVNDTFSLPEDSTSFSLAVLTNDTASAQGTTLTVSAVGTAQHGTLAIANDGKSVLYTPTANFVGTDTFTYTAKDQNGVEQQATVTVNVTGVNDNPVAVNDAFNATEGTSIQLPVLDNDNSGIDTGETLKVQSVTQGNHGGTITVVNNGAAIRYKPAANFAGTETFSYTINDGHGGTSTATVTMTVNGENDPPVGANDTKTVAEDSTDNVINVLANDTTGPDSGETLSIDSISADPEHGTATISNGKILYTPDHNFQGTDTFTYVVKDNNGGTDTAVVTVTVTNVNDAPTAKNDGGLKAVKGSTGNSFDLLKNDSSAPDPTENLVISAVGTPSKGGTVTIAADGKTVLYTPKANFSGSETFTYTIKDPGGLTSTATATVTVSEFSPSSLKGYVYLDTNHNGRRDTDEKPLANVLVTITGKDINGHSVSKNAHTGADGLYEFNNLVAGDYTLKETQPAFLADGKDRAGSMGSSSVGNDEISLKLKEDKHGINYNFGELGTQTIYVRLPDLFAKRDRDVFVAAVGTGGAAGWSQAIGNGWQKYASRELTLSSDGKTLNIKVTDAASNEFLAAVPITDPRVQTMGRTGGSLFIRLAPPSQFNFVPQTEPNENPVVTTTSTTIAYTEGQSIVIDDGVEVTDSDNTTLKGATVAITGNYNKDEDTLVFSATSAITGHFDSATGVLKLTGTASVSAYQAALRSVKYKNTSDSPKVEGRTITFKVDDGKASNNNSNPATRQITPLTGVNDAPTVTTSSGTTTFTAGGSAVAVDANVNVTDPDDTVIKGATVKIGTGFQQDTDVLAFTSQSGITGSYTPGTGILTFTGNSNLATYQTLLRSVSFNSTAQTPSTADRTITFTITDNADATSAVASKVVKFSNPNDTNVAPVVTATGTAISYTSGSAAIAVDPGLTVTDSNSTNLASATVKITSGLNAGHDFLDFTTQNGITGSYISATGTLTLTGSASVANYQTALQSVKYRNDLTPSTASTRTISFAVDDGATSNHASNPSTRTINILAANNFTVSEAAAINTAVGQIISTQATTGTQLSFEIDQPGVDDKVDLNPDDHLDGNPAAPVVLIEYVDFQCPVCKTFHPWVKQLQDALGDKLLVVRRHIQVSVHQNADEAGRAAEAASKQNKFKEYGDLLFDTQDDWKTLAGTDLTNYFNGLATQLNLNVTQFQNDYAAQATIDRVNRDLDEGKALDGGSSSAPTFFLNGVKLTNANVGSPELLTAAAQSAYNAVTRPIEVNRTTGQIVVTKPELFDATGTPTIQLSVNISDDDNTHAENVTIHVTEANTAPKIMTSSGSTSYTENGSAVALDPGLSITDDGTNLTGATVTISGFVANQDALQFTNQNGITGNFNSATGTLTLTGAATVANYQVALRSVTYSNASESPSTAARTIQFTTTDGTLTSTLATKSLVVATANDSPVVSISGGSLAYAENAGEIAVVPSLTITDADSTSLASAVVSFSTGFTTGQDVLLFDSQNGISGTFNSATGQLSLSGNASLADYQTALRSIRYRNNDENPSTTDRVVSVIVNDGAAANANSPAATRTINVTAANDAPIITIPAAQSTAANVSLIFGSASSNAITLADADAGLTDLEVTLTATNGTIDLADITGLNITAGDGTDDTTVTFQGSLTEIAAALNGLSFNPTDNFNGSATLQVAVNDLGHTGGAATSDLKTINITVGSGSGESAVDAALANWGNEDDTAADNSSDFASAADSLYSALGA